MYRPLFIALLLSFPASAFAYLDPGTGSYIFQLLIAGVVGLAFVIKLFWGRIKSFFAKLFGRKSEPPQPESAESPLPPPAAPPPRPIPDDIARLARRTSGR